MARGRKSPPRGEKKEDVFLARVASILECSREKALDLTSISPATTYWLNPLRADVDTTRAELVAAGIASHPINWLPLAYQLDSPKSQLVTSDSFTQGRLYIQSISSMVAVHALDPVDGDVIFDACASPGGKSARAAALTDNDIELYANDSIKSRLMKMESLFELYGVKAAELSAHPAQYLDKFVTRRFDKIILDAQCSGEGLMNTSKRNALQYWSLDRVQEMSYLQQRMLVSAWKILKPGGTLVYSTCTYGPEENESPVDFLLRHHGDADVEPIDAPLSKTMPGLKTWEERMFDPRLKDALRILPSENTSAFFVCKLRKST